ncbi:MULTISPECIES: hypothetical protein [unclassified Pseudomonas]|uniref:hypothetical protein n=1 Tax=unclassified Pseudomonas TaxID=196821 RepID=UPI0025E336C9|nr:MULTISPECIES: hypothetical protein [unclassified Pseudomonas]
MSRIEQLVNAYMEAAQKDQQYWSELLQIVSLVEEKFTEYMQRTPGALDDESLDESRFVAMVAAGTTMPDGTFQTDDEFFVRNGKALNFSIRLDLIPDPTLEPKSFVVINLAVSKTDSETDIVDVDTGNHLHINKDLHAVCKWLHQRCIKEFENL